MPIGSTTTNSSGRTRDIHIMQGVKPNGTINPTTLKFGQVSNFCAGIQKLVQRYMIAFLTTLGSQVDYPNFGTAFMSSTLASNVNPSRLDTQHIFNFSNASVLNTFRAYQSLNPDLPADEQIDTAILSNLTVSASQISLQITITSLAGNVVTFIIPLPESL